MTKQHDNTTTQQHIYTPLHECGSLGYNNMCKETHGHVAWNGWEQPTNTYETREGIEKMIHNTSADSGDAVTAR